MIAWAPPHIVPVAALRARGAIAVPRAALWWLALVAVALALRWPSLGDPLLDTDEQFYLLAGDRLLHGAIPYVDVWDRKPVGLFLLYAGIRLLGGDGIVQYQLVAVLFAGTTAWIVARIAARVTGDLPGAVGGVAYLLWIGTVGGGGGQSPVFYNPLVAGAAWAVLVTLDEPNRRRVLAGGLTAMTLVGLAMQIKYTALFEGAFLGVVLLARLHAVAGTRAALAAAPLLAGVALVPTALAAAAYWLIGEGHAFLFANFLSVSLRAPSDAGAMHARLVQEAAHAGPLLACCAASAWAIGRRGTAAQRRWLGFLVGWLAAAAVGFAALGVFYYHYLLPLYVPLATLAVPALSLLSRAPAVALGAVAWLPLLAGSYPDVATPRRDRAEMAALLALLPADVRSRCLYAHEAPASLYLLGHACGRTRYLFPDHLSTSVEAPALGVDPAAEVARILASAPAAITISLTPAPYRNPATRALVLDALRRHYRLAGRVAEDGATMLGVYVRRR